MASTVSAACQIRRSQSPRSPTVEYASRASAVGPASSTSVNSRTAASRSSTGQLRTGASTLRKVYLTAWRASAIRYKGIALILNRGSPVHPEGARRREGHQLLRGGLHRHQGSGGHRPGRRRSEDP